MSFDTDHIYLREPPDTDDSEPKTTPSHDAGLRRLAVDTALAHGRSQPGWAV